MSEASRKLLRQAAQARTENRLADAMRDLLAAVDICRQAGSRVELAEALKAMGQIERDQHQMDAALQHYEEAAAINREEGDALKLAHTIRHVADIRRNQALHRLAEPSYQEALAIYRSHKQTSALDLANAIRGLAILKSDTGKSEDARLLWEEAKDLYAAVGVEGGVVECSRRLAVLAKPQAE